MLSVFWILTSRPLSLQHASPMPNISSANLSAVLEGVMYPFEATVSHGLRVNVGGDVKGTWQSPAFPGNRCFRYRQVSYIDWKPGVGTEVVTFACRDFGGSR